ncbi:hypothetical protein BH18ACT7_BH18ACT7_04620 [soil metagenome]
MLALLSSRLRTLIIGALLVRLAPILARALNSAADGLRRQGRAGALASVLAKIGNGLSWVARRSGRGRRARG